MQITVLQQAAKWMWIDYISCKCTFLCSSGSFTEWDLILKQWSKRTRLIQEEANECEALGDEFQLVLVIRVSFVNFGPRAKSFVLNLPNFEISSSFRATASPQYTDKRMFSRSCLSLSQVQPHSLLRRSRLIKDFAFLLANEKSWIPRLITVVDISQCWDQWAWRPSTRGAK